MLLDRHHRLARGRRPHLRRPGHGPGRQHRSHTGRPDVHRRDRPLDGVRADARPARVEGNRAFPGPDLAAGAGDVPVLPRAHAAGLGPVFGGAQRPPRRELLGPRAGCVHVSHQGHRPPGRRGAGDRVHVHGQLTPDESPYRGTETGHS